MGFPVKPMSRTYLVYKEANIRAEPSTRSKRLGGFERGERVQVAGAAEGGWLAVTEDGKERGFVYAALLLPLIDGSLDDDLTGRVVVPGSWTCEYTVSFQGRSKVEGEVLETADYEVAFACDKEGRPLEFTAQMFITEAPYQLNQKSSYQISLDVVEVSDHPDIPFSTILIYDRDKERVAFDGISVDRLGRPPRSREKPVKTVPEALAAAIEIAVDAWSDAAWVAIAKNWR